MIQQNWQWHGVRATAVAITAFFWLPSTAQAAVIAQVAKEKETIVVDLEKGDRHTYQRGETISLQISDAQSIDGTVTGKKGNRIFVSVDFGLEHAQNGLKVTINSDEKEAKLPATKGKTAATNKKSEKKTPPPPAAQTVAHSVPTEVQEAPSAPKAATGGPFFRPRKEGLSSVKIYPPSDANPEAVDLEHIDGETSFLGTMTFAKFETKVALPDDLKEKIGQELLSFQAGIMSHINEKMSVQGLLNRSEFKSKLKLEQGNKSLTLNSKGTNQVGGLQVSYKLNNEMILGLSLYHLEADREADSVTGKKLEGSNDHNYAVPSLMYMSGKGETIVAWQAPYSMANDGVVVTDEGYFAVRHHYQLTPNQSLEGQVARLFWSAIDSDDSDQFYFSLGSHFQTDSSILGATFGWAVQHNDGGDKLNFSNDDAYHLSLDYKLPMLNNGSFLMTKAIYYFSNGSANGDDWKSNGYVLQLTLNYVL